MPAASVLGTGRAAEADLLDSTGYPETDVAGTEKGLREFLSTGGRASMNAGQSGSQHGGVPGGRMSQNQCAVLLVGLTVGVSLAAIFFVRPHVGPWLDVRSASRSLSSADSDARNDAIRLLRSRGEESERALIALLHHSNTDVRDFAAYSLSHETTDEVIEAFLTALENNQHVAEIGSHAPRLFFTHAEGAAGPLTRTDRRMIAWLRSELNSTNPDRSGTAAWALTAFANRDPSLREPLTAYLKNGVFLYRYLVLREMAHSDPSMRDQYVDVLLSGLGSAVPVDRSNALYGLANWNYEPDDLRARLEARREGSTDPGEISRIDQALEELRMRD